MQTKFCTYCRTVKTATPENFQRRGHLFRSPCKACQKKIKNRKKPLIEQAFNEVMPNVKFTDMNLSKSQMERLSSKVEVKQEEVLVDIGYALNAIYERHQRFFTFEVGKNKVKLTFHGSPTKILTGTVNEVIEAALA